MTDELKKKNAARLSICSNAFLTVSKIVTGASVSKVLMFSSSCAILDMPERITNASAKLCR